MQIDLRLHYRFYQLRGRWSDFERGRPRSLRQDYDFGGVEVLEESLARTITVSITKTITILGETTESTGGYSSPVELAPDVVCIRVSRDNY